MFVGAVDLWITVRRRRHQAGFWGKLEAPLASRCDEFRSPTVHPRSGSCTAACRGQVVDTRADGNEKASPAASPTRTGPRRGRGRSPNRANRGYLRRPGAPALGPRRRRDRFRADALLHRIPQDRRLVRGVGRGLSAPLPQSQRAGQARRAGHAAAERTRRPPPLCAHQLDSQRWGEPAAFGDEQGGERGFGAAGVSRGRREGLPPLAERASAPQL